MRGNQFHPLREFEKEQERQRRTIFDLTQNQQFAKVAARGYFRAPLAGASASIMSVPRLTSRNGGHAGCWGTAARHRAKQPQDIVR